MHSSSSARTCGFCLSIAFAASTMPGVTSSTLTFSPAATASKPGTPMQSTMTKRLSSTLTPHSSLISAYIGLSASPLAVKTATFWALPYAVVIAGSCASADMKTGTVVELCSRMYFCTYIMKPQSPVMPVPKS